MSIGVLDERARELYYEEGRKNRVNKDCLSIYLQKPVNLIMVKPIHWLVFPLLILWWIEFWRKMFFIKKNFDYYPPGCNEDQPVSAAVLWPIHNQPLIW